MHNKKKGYILILSLMIISLAVTLVTYIFYVGSVQMPYSYTVINREKAKLLALSGIQIAIAKLSQEIEKKDGDKKVAQPSTTSQAVGSSPTADKKNEPSDQEQAARKLIEEMVPALNRWQSFALKEEIDGVDGTIRLCIGSESGKLDLNALYDFEKHAFKGDTAKQDVLKLLITTAFKQAGKEDLFAEFEKFLKARQYRLDDITQLLTIPGFIAFKDIVFYPGPLKEKEEKNKTAVYLTDIFTVWSGKQTVDPWLLSDSMCGLLGVKRATVRDADSRKKAVEQVIKDVKIEAQWPVDWKKYLSPLYGVEFNTLPKGIELVFDTKFEPKIFSVLSHGVVGDVTQKMLAILERTEEKNDKKLAYTVTIKKLYWL